VAYVRICPKAHGTKFGIYGTKVAQNTGVVSPLKAVGGKLT